MRVDKENPATIFDNWCFPAWIGITRWFIHQGWLIAHRGSSDGSGGFFLKTLDNPNKEI